MHGVFAGHAGKTWGAQPALRPIAGMLQKHSAAAQLPSAVHRWRDDAAAHAGIQVLHWPAPQMLPKHPTPTRTLWAVYRNTGNAVISGLPGACPPRRRDVAKALVTNTDCMGYFRNICNPAIYRVTGACPPRRRDVVKALVTNTDCMGHL